MNCCQLVGRMVRDPEVKYSNDGHSVARFTVAIDRKFKKEGQPEADFIPCKAFGRTAEFVEKYFCKGMRIGLYGSIQTGSYTNQSGVTVYTTDVLVDGVEFVESKQQQEQKPAQPSNQPLNHGNANDGFMNLPDGIDEELPFS